MIVEKLHMRARARSLNNALIDEKLSNKTLRQRKILTERLDKVNFGLHRKVSSDATRMLVAVCRKLDKQSRSTPISSTN